MKRFLFNVIVSVFVLTSVQSSWGAEIKAYVAEFSVSGYQNKDELAAALRTLLMTRMNSSSVMVVDAAGDADVTVSGSYLVIGKMFSLDAVAKSSRGTVLCRAFVQGESIDELIPAVGKLAKTLSDDLQKSAAVAPEAVRTLPSAVPRERSAAPEVVRRETVPAPAGDIVRPQTLQKAGASGWVSQRLDGALTGIAMGRTAGGERELYVAGEHSFRYYRLGDVLRLVQEVAFGPDEKVLSVDTADLDGDSVSEVYVTVVRGDSLSSQVWIPSGNSLKKIADRLPYFMRTIYVGNGEKKLYAQEMSMDGSYYGDVAELVKSGDRFSLKNPLKLPRFGNIYNFSMFRDEQGKGYYLAFSPDGYLLVYASDGEELWKSSDKFGGSENSFKRPYPPSVSSGDKFAAVVFLDQRITVTKDGEIIVPQNGGFWVLGNNRSYSKSSLFAFKWNGSALQEEWHTTQSQNYLADYGYDADRREIVGVEVVKKEGILGKGASTVIIKKID